MSTMLSIQVESARGFIKLCHHPLLLFYEYFNIELMIMNHIIIAPMKNDCEKVILAYKNNNQFFFFK